MVFLGIDVGTQGVRAVAADENGKIIARAHKEYAHVNIAPAAKQADGWREQDPNEWWDCTQTVLRELNIDRPDTVCVDGTSGTIIALDENNDPVYPGIMYNDARGNGGKALPKIKWLRDNGYNAHRYVHQADFISGRLTGEYGVTDWSNALKSGLNIQTLEWSDEARELFGENIPQVVPVGAKGAGNLIHGASDGYMSAIATCAVNPGEWASIIGTTLILKGVTRNYIDDPTGCVYCHKHPQGFWMPGGASNVGGRVLNEWFVPEGADADKIFAEANADVPRRTPTGKLVYPLLVPGERFPFLNKTFAGFGPHDDYTAVLEGITYVEKLCFDALEKLGCEVGDTIYSTGGACKSDEWLKLRADIIGKAIKVPEVTDAAIGGAMLGAAATVYDGIADAVSHMGRFEKIVEPTPGAADRYQEIYGKFKEKINEYI